MRNKRQYREKRPRLGCMADRTTETIPSFTRILARHSLCSADLPIPDAFDLFTRIGSDPVVMSLKPRATVPRTNVLGIYASTAAALDKMTAAQLTALTERLAQHFQLSA
jgi:hypothetical protein